MATITLAAARRAAIARLQPHSPSPEADVAELLQHTLGYSASQLITRDREPLSAQQIAQIDALIERRLSGEPIAYITGKRGFWTLELSTDPNTLIPRPETELLVELGLAFLPERACRVLDMGTGTGAIALSLGSERPEMRIIATDINPATLAVARDNARRCDIGNVEFRQGSWFSAIAADERFDLIVSNPPYIEASDPHLTRGDLRFEPRAALESGADGLDDLHQICSGASDFLTPGGMLAVEHGHDQQAAVIHLMRTNGLIEVTGHNDLNGLNRCVTGLSRQT